MNILIVYDSHFGNTQHIAATIASLLEPRGVIQLVPVIEADPFRLRDIDLLVMGCPTQSHHLTPAVRDFLKRIPRRSLRGLRAATFDTRYRRSRFITGSAAEDMARKLQRAGATLIVPAESFFVAGREGPLEEGEIGRVQQWTQVLLEQLESDMVRRT
ncbi:MAG TPA: flavodoxin domain-containing protein [Ktedonobacteraceae bacterium]|nr:flavodoxin domain-containing protein [Ktedonobacteraceae bacterium]